MKFDIVTQLVTEQCEKLCTFLQVMQNVFVDWALAVPF
jgi:hypothetical protein